MWKVKRMNTARIVVLTIAIGAGGIAAYLASGSDNKPPPTEPVAQLQTVDVLVAKSDIGLGQTVKADDMQWQTWPAATASNIFIRRSERPDAATQIAGSIARCALHRRRADPRAEAGQGRRVGLHGRDPAHRHARRLDRNFAGDRRRRLHPAQRPRRRHSVQAREEPGSLALPAISSISEIILANIRVLAIDQAPKEKDGQNVVVGKTVTLELKPEQTPTLARRAPGRHAVAGAAQHRRRQHGREHRVTIALASAPASMWFAMASTILTTTQK